MDAPTDGRFPITINIDAPDFQHFPYIARRATLSWSSSQIDVAFEAAIKDEKLCDAANAFFRHMQEPALVWNELTRWCRERQGTEWSQKPFLLHQMRIRWERMREHTHVDTEKWMFLEWIELCRERQRVTRQMHIKSILKKQQQKYLMDHCVDAHYARRAVWGREPDEWHKTDLGDQELEVQYWEDEFEGLADLALVARLNRLSLT